MHKKRVIKDRVSFVKSTESPRLFQIPEHISHIGKRRIKGRDGGAHMNFTLVSEKDAR